MVLDVAYSGFSFLISPTVRSTSFPFLLMTLTRDYSYIKKTQMRAALVQEDYPQSFRYGLDLQISPSGSEQEAEMSPVPSHTGHNRAEKNWGFANSRTLFLHAVWDYLPCPPKPPSPLPVAHITSHFRAKTGSTLSTAYLALHLGVWAWLSAFAIQMITVTTMVAAHSRPLLSFLKLSVNKVLIF